MLNYEYEITNDNVLTDEELNSGQFIPTQWRNGTMKPNPTIREFGLNPFTGKKKVQRRTSQRGRHPSDYVTRCLVELVQNLKRQNVLGNNFVTRKATKRECDERDALQKREIELLTEYNSLKYDPCEEEVYSLEELENA